MGQDGVDFEELGGALETVLCLILPGQQTGGPERVRAWLKVTQRLGREQTCLLARGPGRAPLCEGGISHLPREFNNE